MPHFSFQALSAGGEQISGMLEAASRGDAYRQIEARRLSPLEVVEKDSAAKTGRLASAAEPPLRLKRGRLIFFTSELADLIDAGLPVQQALNVMAEKQQDPVIRKTGDRLRYHLRDGQTLSACFRQTSPSFDDLYVSLIAAGEAGDMVLHTRCSISHRRR